MQRRGSSGQPVKGQSANRPKARNAPTAQVSTADLQEQLDRAKRERDEALEQLAATSEVLHIIGSSFGELKLVFRTMLEKATTLCEATFGNMYLRKGDVFELAATYNSPPALVEERARAPYILKAGSASAPDRIVRTKSVVHIVDLASSEFYLSREPRAVAGVELGGVRTLLLVPMLKDNEVVGYFAIFRQEVKPFTERQIELVKNFAAQAVIAIENTRLLNELRQRTDDLSESLEQQTATSEVLKVISSSAGELRRVFETMLENAVRICGAKFGNLWLREGDVFRIGATHGAPQAYVDYIRREQAFRPDPRLGLGQVLRTKEASQAADIAAVPTHGGKARQALINLAGARTLINVPMLKDNEVIGVIGVYRQEVRPFTDKQIELVKSFAAQAVIAIENARLLGELRESLQQQTATADVLKVISRSTFDLRAVLRTLVESAARLCDADKAVITREKNGAFYRTEAYGYSREFMEYIKEVPIEIERGSASGRALLEGRAVHIPDVMADPEYTMVEAQKLGNFRTMLSVPMLREGVPIGVLNVTRSEVRPFTDKQIELVTTFADQAAIAIENVRLFESVEARTRELAQSLEDLRTTQDRLVQTQKLASLGQLTAGIAHEIKNPLNFVNNFSAVSVELIDELRQTLSGAHLDNKLRAEISEIADTLQGNLDKVVQHGKRADAIVKNMLLHSREGSGEHRMVDINALVEESLNLA
ncbi:MAG: GAF domain-containing protein, partial [Pseudolabrys sp.]